ncbi:hypothetical protein BTUL_0166g00190 [Botrytis tulipae]|uniref:Uncharacterized protein n=1 Tax=Botrytis tulipae TaxID=87230 RepID=A0A4Z1EJ91_9HELO|nr:hypothetical protein BTUL_0166g00190 [Botrytis tulipae]
MAPRKFNLNGKTLTAPLAAATMALLLFTYTRTSIRAAKQNAQKHREADGGQIDWANESLRRHGQLDAPVEQTTVKQLLGTAKDNLEELRRKGNAPERHEVERKLRERAAKGREGGFARKAD